MKSSSYNFFYPLEESGNVLSYNALSNSLCILDHDVVQAIENLDEQPLSFTSDLITELQTGRFILDDGFNEIMYLRHRQQQNQYANQQMSLTIAPTINCNLACPYCFESHVKGKMSEEVIDSIVSFSRNLIESKGLKLLGVTWYGGEPLLYPEVIDHLGKELVDLCQEKEITYTSHIITNGTRYTPEIAHMLKERGVEYAQITIDGDKVTHDCRRVNKGGGGSFDKILANIEATVGILPIVIRINVDKSNAHLAHRLVEHFAAKDWFNRESIRFYLGHVRVYTKNEAERALVLQPEEFHQANAAFKQAAHQGREELPEFPKPGGGCVATNVNGFVIGPNGGLWKCWSSIGKEEDRFGNVLESHGPNSHFLEYMGETWEQDEECRSCKVLPICMGGCTDVRINRNRGMNDHKDCGVWRYNIHEKIQTYFQAVQSQLTEEEQHVDPPEMVGADGPLPTFPLQV